MSFTGSIENRDRPVTIELDFKYPVWRIKRRFALSAIIGPTNSGKIFFGMLTEASRQEDRISVKPFGIHTRLYASGKSVKNEIWILGKPALSAPGLLVSSKPAVRHFTYCRTGDAFDLMMKEL
jgi:hypothetical protein